MAREVNLQISNWTPVGTNASVPRYSVTLTTQWIDSRWFFEMVNGGRMVTPFDLASYSTLVNMAGAPGAPVTDMRGVAQVGAQREIGSLEYDTYTAVPGGPGTPMILGGGI